MHLLALGLSGRRTRYPIFESLPPKCHVELFCECLDPATVCNVLDTTRNINSLKLVLSNLSRIF